MRSGFRFFITISILILLGSVYSAKPTSAQTPSVKTVLLDARDMAGLDWLHAANAIWLADYGSICGGLIHV
jgi:hypothetical protein